jgi:hypothetical protein
MKRAGLSGRTRLTVLLGVVALLASAIMLPWTETRTYYRPSGWSGFDFVYTGPLVPDRIETQTCYRSVFNLPHEEVDTDQSGLVKIITDYRIDHVRLLLEWLLIVLVTIELILALRLKDQRPLGRVVD